MKKKELIIILGSLLIVVLSVTLAYFTTEIFGSGKDISVESTDLKIIFTAGTGTIAGTEIVPGWSSGVNTFTVKNESNSAYKYNIVIKDLVNTFATKGYLLYKITSADGGYNMGDFKDVPKSSTQKDKVLAYSVEIAKGDTHTYSVEFKYENSSEVDQSDDMGRILSGTLYIEKGTLPLTLAEKLLEDNPTIQTRGSFSAVFTTTNTGTLYKATESIAGSTAKDVYYFAGDAKNNWVKFGTYKINGPIRGYFGSTSISYREYASMEECTSASSYNYNCSYTWSAGDDIYWRIIRTNHDGSIRLLYSGTSLDTTEGYIGTSAFNKEFNSPKYVGYMYGEDDSTLEGIRANTKDSTIKTYIDNWYNTNLTSYTKYISTDAVYCNDRKAPSYNANSSVNYYIITRLSAGNPTYDCEDIKDAFSGTNNEAKLTYPIGLMTADEITYAGGYKYTSLTSPYAWYYLNSTGGSITGSTYWWLLSPGYWDGSYAGSWFVNGSDSPGNLSNNYVGDSNRVRPVISIKSCTLWLSGNGSSSSPYEINLDTDISC